MRAGLEQQIRARGLGDNVWCCWVIVSTCRRSSGARTSGSCARRQGLSNAIIEYMAGLVAGGGHGGGRQRRSWSPRAGLARDGHLIPPHRPAILADRLEGLAPRPRALRRARRRRRARVEADLTLTAMIEKPARSTSSPRVRAVGQDAARGLRLATDVEFDLDHLLNGS